MALWPFGKKKKREEAPVEEQKETAPLVDESQEPAPAGSTNTDAPAEPAASEAVEEQANAGTTDPVTIPHDAINGETGPFDGDSVDINEFDFSDVSDGVLNLGSIALPLPKNSQVQVEMGETGPRMLHVVTEHGRITPVAFAAPSSGGMWEESSNEIAEGMRTEGMPATFETGPWGREVVGRGDNGVIRIIGVEGPRWLYRLTLAAPHGKEDALAEVARGVVARSFVYRGNTAILAGNSLPVELPAPLAAQLQQAMDQQAQQIQQAQQAQQANQPTQPENEN
ncbi:DUF3710 domain-containing protein [Corynebacterium meitnerae]|uniref:DUF3710 domain-containing protein n=1 Tax=Corynebacterium meitnerae TaxID=2913498 RepID=A0A9X3LUI1_9CORY|nr:DUF3710 domain-containing protein [Corynebacterium meitnerae]MCZ9294477.1 DUF3710 domain-containing protein [Corynebacterium meitnerae]